MPTNAMKLYALVTLPKDVQFSEEARLAMGRGELPRAYTTTLLPARTSPYPRAIVEYWAFGVPTCADGERLHTRSSQGPSPLCLQVPKHRACIGIVHSLVSKSRIRAGIAPITPTHPTRHAVFVFVGCGAFVALLA